ncbi:MAG: nitrous oxide reductase family maturation protein NosD [Alphaproteobacteria bacterium]|nr:nitrous oxide reductase family maturation protein NosD [Alphaproteobacteria bacterium]
MAMGNAGAGVIEVGAHPVIAGSGQLVLQDALRHAKDGDTLRLLPGVHHGPVTITKSISLVGATTDAVIKGNGVGSVVTVKASDVLIEGLTVTGSGLLLETQDTGIFLSKEARNAKILENRVLDNLIGIYVWGAKNALVKGNKIEGRRDLRVNERGNGVQLWNATGSRVEGNHIRYGRDGIFVTTSKKNSFTGNVMEDLRFAVHYMYTNSSSVRGNISRRNHLGFAIMFSKKIDVENNLSQFDRDRGILFNYANQVRVRGNAVIGGPKKCVFIYNSNKNEISGNLFSRCAIGIHFTGGSERNQLYGNAFVENRTQVKYVGSRWVEWSHKGTGNYWSDHTAFDLNRDGVADAAYRPNDLTDQILWRFPAAKLLTNSPAIQVLKWAQSSFPALHPGGVVDSAPLMTVPGNLAKHLEPSS